jgi:hypothetical protein
MCSFRVPPGLGQITRIHPFGYGKCACGCGGSTPLVDGFRYAIYLRGHSIESKRRARAEAASRERGLQESVSASPPGWQAGTCLCGCGEKTTVDRNGVPRRFRQGHSSRTESARKRQSELGRRTMAAFSGDPYWGPGRSHRGVVWSDKVVAEVLYMSELERYFFELLGQLREIESFQEQPFSIPYEMAGARHAYTPDALLFLADGRRVLVEVKPTARLGARRNLAKFRAAASYCEEAGTEFRIWTEKHQARLSVEAVDGMLRWSRPICTWIGSGEQRCGASGILMVPVEDSWGWRCIEHLEFQAT